VSWRRFLNRGTWDDERARELDAHLAIETDDNLARGMSPAEARDAARRKLGNATLVREEIYQMNTLTLVDAAWRDLKYGARLLRVNPAFAIVAILSLALGVGANTAIFQLLDAVRLRTLPVKNADELAEVRIAEPVGGRTGQFTGRRPSLTNPLWEQVRERQQVFSEIFAWAAPTFDLTTGGEARSAQGLWVSGDFFKGLGVAALIGRTQKTASTPAARRRSAARSCSTATPSTSSGSRRRASSVSKSAAPSTSPCRCVPSRSRAVPSRRWTRRTSGSSGRWAG
jgi:hypothetical protein